MSILYKLEQQFINKEKLKITPNEYQKLCLEVFTLGLPKAADYDDLILNYRYNGLSVIVDEEIE